MRKYKWEIVACFPRIGRTLLLVQVLVDISAEVDSEKMVAEFMQQESSVYLEKGKLVSHYAQQHPILKRLPPLSKDFS